MSASTDKINRIATAAGQYPPVSREYPLDIVDLGWRDFGEVWALQLDTVARRQRDEIEDTLLLVEHPDVITLGRRTNRENLLRPADTPLYEIERGGDVTYHGPGQLVGYPILKLREGERDLHRYLRGLEEAIIRAVAELGLAAGRRAGWTGVWIDETHKLASIGVAVKRWVTLHGFAVNIATDLARFAAINPCGLDAAVMTSVSESLGRPVAVSALVEPISRHLGAALGRRGTKAMANPR